MSSNILNPKVWLVTGSSSGIGRQIVLEALSRGDKVIATARSLSSIEDLESGSCKILQLDVTDDISVIQLKAAEALQVWNRVDVLVNNAGSGLIGFTEEIPHDDYVGQFQVNLFGHLNITSAFLPQMRERKDGTVVFIGSRSSYRSHIPMTGSYVSSKAALSGVADTLSSELAPFNIRVLNVIPGAIRTEAWNSARIVAPASGPIADYDAMRKQCMDGLVRLKQKAAEAADPRKAAKVIVDVVRGEGVGVRAKEIDGWPSILVLGEDGESDVRRKCEKVLKTLDEWKDVTLSVSS